MEKKAITAENTPPKRKVAKISNDEKRQKAYERIIAKYDEAFRVLAKK